MTKCEQCNRRFPSELVMVDVCPICALKNRNAIHGLPERTPFHGEIAAQVSKGHQMKEPSATDSLATTVIELQRRLDLLNHERASMLQKLDETDSLQRENAALRERLAKALNEIDDLCEAGYIGAQKLAEAEADRDLWEWLRKNYMLIPMLFRYVDGYFTPRDAVSTARKAGDHLSSEIMRVTALGAKAEASRSGNNG